MSIMERGGGIYNTVKATQAASFDELYAAADARLNKMAAMGVTTVEGKSGYGLDLETELKQLRVMQRLQGKHRMNIVSTYLGAHAVPSGISRIAGRFICRPFAANFRQGYQGAGRKQYSCHTATLHCFQIMHADGR